MFEEPAEPFLSHDLPRRERQRGRLGFLRVLAQRAVADALVRAFLVVMLQEIFGDTPQAILTQDEELVETFDAQGLCEASGEGVPLRDRIHHTQTVAMEPSGSPILSTRFSSES
jgi:hypothetical protein